MQDIVNRDEDHYETLDKIVSMWIVGNKNATQIAKDVGLPRKDVLNYIDEWKSIAANTDHLKDRATQALNEMDKHYDLILRKQWEIANDETVNANVRANTLKQIADVEVKRQEALQKAGLYDDSGLADQIVEMESNVEKIQELLLAVAKAFPETSQYINERLVLLAKGAVVFSEDGSIIKGEVTDNK